MRVIVFCLPGLGDALMATPMIQALKHQYPDWTIDVGCMFDGVRSVFQGNSAVSTVHRFPDYTGSRIKWLQAVLALRRLSYDISILAYPAYRREYNLIPVVAGAQRRISHSYKRGYWSEGHFLHTDLVPVDEKLHIVLNNMNLLKPLGIPTTVDSSLLTYDLRIQNKDREFGSEYIKNLRWSKEPIIGLHPGSIESKLGRMKRWPVDRFAELANKLAHRGNKVLVFIGPDEIHLGTELIKTADPKWCQIVLNVKFNQAVGILSHVKLLVTNDNGFAHISNALKVRSIVLFGPTNPVWCSPYDDRFTRVIRKAHFSPWFRNDMKVSEPPRGAKSGMESITVSDVLKGVTSFL